jgi:8-oxo-dGTP pyrophosphatase MutT (NUDIX family)
MDVPVGFTKDGRPVYDNTPTVVALLAEVRGRLIVVRRNNEPGTGLLGLPGGYHMRGESWQEAGCRECLEETGYSFAPSDVEFVSLATDEYGNNLIIAKNTGPHVRVRNRDPNEVQELLLIEAPGSAHDWAFPRHYRAVIDFFRGAA